MIPNSLSRGAKILISSVLIFHFGAVLLAGFGIGSHTHPAPAPLAYAHDRFCHYLRTLNLDSPWHFYAPNPGHDSVLYVRLETQSGKRVWRQWPDGQRSRLVESYVREFGGASNAASIAPTPDGPAPYVLTRHGEVALGAFARRFATQAGQQWASDDPVSHVGFVLLTGRPMSPRQAREGWQFGDLRLYEMIAIGNFTAEGRVLRSLPVRTLDPADLAFDVLKCLRQADEPDENRPLGIRVLLEQHPDWLKLSDSELRAKLKKHFVPEDMPGPAPS